MPAAVQQASTAVQQASMNQSRQLLFIKMKSLSLHDMRLMRQMALIQCTGKAAKHSMIHTSQAEHNGQ